MLAGLDDLVTRGLADPSRVVLAGWSWGGYVTLLGIGRHPEPVHIRDCRRAGRGLRRRVRGRGPILQAMDRSLMGGSPADVPALPRAQPADVRGWRARPAADPRGRERLPLPDPPGLELRRTGSARGGVEPEIYTYSTGHSSFDVEERVRQTAIALDFLARTVPGVDAARGPRRASRGGGGRRRLRQTSRGPVLVAQPRGACLEDALHVRRRATEAAGVVEVGACPPLIARDATAALSSGRSRSPSP